MLVPATVAVGVGWPQHQLRMHAPAGSSGRKSARGCHSARFRHMLSAMKLSMRIQQLLHRTFLPYICICCSAHRISRTDSKNRSWWSVSSFTSQALMQTMKAADGRRFSKYSFSVRAGLDNRNGFQSHVNCVQARGAPNALVRCAPVTCIIICTIKTFIYSTLSRSPVVLRSAASSFTACGLSPVNPAFVTPSINRSEIHVPYDSMQIAGAAPPKANSRQADSVPQ
jgi:hypothetical protein